MVEWLGKELDNKPPGWKHVHAYDGLVHEHAYNESCFLQRAFPDLRLDREKFVEDPESIYVWVYIDADKYLASIDSETKAVELAGLYPTAIYFFADSVSHPNS